MITTKYTVDVSRDIINKLIDNPNMMTEIHQLLAETVNPWTPYLSGNLSTDLTIDETGVTYNADYAFDKYYGNVYTKEYHPLATSHWDEVAMQTELETFQKKVTEIISKYANQ